MRSPRKRNYIYIIIHIYRYINIYVTILCFWLLLFTLRAKTRSDFRHFGKCIKRCRLPLAISCIELNLLSFFSFFRSNDASNEHAVKNPDEIASMVDM